MIIAALILAQVVGKAPATTPTPKPYASEVPAQEMGRRPQTGLPNAAGQIKLKKGVSFEQEKTPAPPTPASTTKAGPAAVPAIGPATATAAASPATLPDPAVPTAAEISWRAKYRACRDDLRAARAALEAAELANPPVYNQAGQLLVLAETQRNATIGAHKAKLAAAEAAMASLPEDCRKAGCQPGWLRD